MSIQFKFPTVIAEIICQYTDYIGFVPLKIYEHNIKKIDNPFCYLCNNEAISIKWLTLGKYWKMWKRDKCCWRILCANENIPCYFFERNLKYIKNLKRGDKIPSNFPYHMDINIELMSGIELLCRNENIPWSFIYKHMAYFKSYPASTILYSKSNLPIEVLVYLSKNTSDLGLLSYLLYKPNLTVSILENILVNCKSKQDIDWLIYHMQNANVNSEILKYVKNKYPSYIKEIEEIDINLHWNKIRHLKHKLTRYDYRNIICYNNEIGKEFFYECKEEIKAIISDEYDMDLLTINKSLPEDLLIYFIDFVKCEDLQYWSILCSAYNLPIKFLEKNLPSIKEYWRIICARANSETRFKFIEKYTSEWYDSDKCWYAICESKMPIKFIEKHVERLDTKSWEILCRREDPNLLQFLERHPHKCKLFTDVHWQNLFKNPAIPRAYSNRELKKLLSHIVPSKFDE